VYFSQNGFTCETRRRRLIDEAQSPGVLGPPRLRAATVRASRFPRPEFGGRRRDDSRNGSYCEGPGSPKKQRSKLKASYLRAARSIKQVS
jgi:hypothetical protein